MFQKMLNSSEFALMVNNDQCCEIGVSWCMRIMPLLSYEKE